MDWLIFVGFAIIIIVVVVVVAASPAKSGPISYQDIFQKWYQKIIEPGNEEKWHDAPPKKEVAALLLYLGHAVLSATKKDTARYMREVDVFKTVTADSAYIKNSIRIINDSSSFFYAKEAEKKRLEEYCKRLSEDIQDLCEYYENAAISKEVYGWWSKTTPKVPDVFKDDPIACCVIAFGDYLRYPSVIKGYKLTPHDYHGAVGDYNWINDIIYGSMMDQVFDYCKEILSFK